MINDQLLGYIRQQMSLKVSKDTIAFTLKGAGWTEEDISEAFKAITPAAPVFVPATPVTPARAANPVNPVNPVNSISSINPASPSTSPAPVMSPVFPTSPTPTADSMIMSATANPYQPIDLSDKPTPQHKSKKTLIVVILLILLGLAGGVAAYAYYTGTFIFQKTETFEQVFTKAMDKIGSQKYTKSTSEINITLKDEKTIAQLNIPAGAYPQINFLSEAVMSREDLNNSSKDKVSMSTTFDMKNVLKDPIMAKIDFLMPEPMVFYIKLSELTGLPEGTPALSASLFQGKWWKMDVKALIKNFGGAEADKILESVDNTQLSKEKLEKIKVILKKYLNLAHVEKLADGVIKGAPAYHFSVGFEKKQFIDMFMEISEVTQTDSADEMKIQTADLKTDIEEIFNMIDIKPIDLLIQKRDYIPVQTTFSSAILDKEGKNIADLNMTYTTSSSEPVEIKAPAESTDILYLMGPIIQSSLESARQKGSEAAIKANLSSMRAQAEIFYSTVGSYSGFCSSSELKSARTSIEGQGGTGFVCRDTVKLFVVSVKMPATSDYWCVDSTGVSKSVATSPSGLACPLN